MANWILKTEPGDYSFSDLEQDGETIWDGVGNNLALQHMRKVRRGDLAMIYHTGKERAVVGTARVTSDPYPDPERDDARLVVFDLEPDRRLSEPVTLAAIKADPAFADLDLVRIPRLSVLPVPAAMWKKILAMGG